MQPGTFPELCLAVKRCHGCSTELVGRSQSALLPSVSICHLAGRIHTGLNQNIVPILDRAFNPL